MRRTISECSKWHCIFVREWMSLEAEGLIGGGFAGVHLRTARNSAKPRPADCRRPLPCSSMSTLRTSAGAEALSDLSRAMLMPGACVLPCGAAIHRRQLARAARLDLWASWAGDSAIASSMALPYALGHRLELILAHGGILHAFERPQRRYSHVCSLVHPQTRPPVQLGVAIVHRYSLLTYRTTIAAPEASCHPYLAFEASRTPTQPRRRSYHAAHATRQPRRRSHWSA
jgi:hypothetical protein